MERKVCDEREVFDVFFLPSVSFMFMCVVFEIKIKEVVEACEGVFYSVLFDFLEDDNADNNDDDNDNFYNNDNDTR